MHLIIVEKNCKTITAYVLLLLLLYNISIQNSAVTFVSGSANNIFAWVQITPKASHHLNYLVT